MKCLELAAQQVDCPRYEVLGRQSFGRHISSSFQERPAVSSVQNASDDGQCTLTSTHSTCVVRLKGPIEKSEALSNGNKRGDSSLHICQQLCS